MSQLAVDEDQYDPYGEKYDDSEYCTCTHSFFCTCHTTEDGVLVCQLPKIERMEWRRRMEEENAADETEPEETEPEETEPEETEPEE
jgi:hypothetical protein